VHTATFGIKQYMSMCAIAINRRNNSTYDGYYTIETQADAYQSNSG